MVPAFSEKLESTYYAGFDEKERRYRYDKKGALKEGIVSSDRAGEQAMDPEVVNLHPYTRGPTRGYSLRAYISRCKIACVQKKALYDANSAPGEEDLND